MPLIQCNECGGQMSDKAASCPKCGAPNPNASQPAGGGSFTQQPNYAFAPQAYFNPCARHPQKPSVATCGNCGSNMCSDCKDLSVLTLDNRPLCIDCTLLYMQERISHLKSSKRWSCVKFFFFLILLLFAWSVYTRTKDQSADNAIITAWLIASVGGIIGSLNLAHRSPEEKAADAIYTKLNPGDGAFNEGMGCFIRIIFAVLLAPLFTVGSCLKHLIRWISSSVSLRSAKKEYANYTATLREHGEM